MGFFSWNCKECGHPMLCPAATNENNEWMSSVVVIEDDGTILKGDYDGYGRVGERDINIDFNNEPECRHTACWEKAGKPINYTGQSEYAEDQGWFFNNKDHDMKEPVTKEKTCDQEEQ